MPRKKAESIRHPIPLTIWSADRALMAKLDAALWFRQAQPDELERLANAEWSGRGNAASPLRFFERLDQEVEILIKYAIEARTELCFEFDAAAASTWVAKYRPALQARKSGKQSGRGTGRHLPLCAPLPHTAATRTPARGFPGPLVRGPSAEAEPD